MTKAEQAAWFDGFTEGLRAYAWWKDGVQYVGTCGNTLIEAIEFARKAHGIDKVE